MRIGIYYSSIARELGGGARFESEVTQAIAKQADSRFEFVLISRQPNSLFGLRNIQIPYPSRKRKLLESLGMLSCESFQTMVIDPIIHDNEIDLVYSPHTETICQSIPFMVTCWDLQHRMQPFFPEVTSTGYNWAKRESHYQQVLPRATAVITGTQQGKDEVERFFGVAPGRVSVIPFSVPGTFQGCTANKPVWAPGSSFVVYPAQFWPHKNHATIVHALRELKQSFGTHVTAVFPGSSMIDQSCTRTYIEGLARDTGVTVEFPGFVSDEELRWLYENATALVFASLYGPDNLPPLEAMSLKCPVIASKVPGAEEQLGDAALLVPSADEFAMASAIHKVATESDVRDGLIARGTRLTNDLPMSRYAEGLMELFDRFARVRRCWPANSGG